jgi:hypothetical protein
MGERNRRAISAVRTRTLAAYRRQLVFENKLVELQLFHLHTGALIVWGQALKLFLLALTMEHTHI